MKPCTLVIFGATGDLSTKKILPALYHLNLENRLHDNARIICIGRQDITPSDWQTKVTSYLSEFIPYILEKESNNKRHHTDTNDAILSEYEALFTRAGLCSWDRDGKALVALAKLLAKISYIKCDLNDANAYQQLSTLITTPDHGFCQNIVFYLSISPALFGTVAHQLATVGLNKEQDGWRRLVVEKPFGYDKHSANELERTLKNHFSENQTYRIDHYLGKETVQNILVFRFANAILAPAWNRHYIDHIQITHAEEQGVAGRAGYYDGAGAMRDMMQSHLLQVMTLLAIEPPTALSDDALRDEKVKVLKAVRPIDDKMISSHACRGQYTGYIQEGAPADSVTETYAALKIYIDNERWQGVPFYLRTGKCMPTSKAMIAVRFKTLPQTLFSQADINKSQANWLVINLQPDDTLLVDLQAKQPGLDMTTRPIRLKKLASKRNRNKDAYESLMLDAILGDRSLFLRADEVDLAWQVVDPVIKKWAEKKQSITTYSPNTWGPEEVSRIFDDPKHQWRN